MDYVKFKAVFYSLSKIDLNSYKEKQMKRRIESFVKRQNFIAYEDFLNVLMKKEKLYLEFLKYITINVTEFYRNPSQWYVFENEILPSVLQKTKTPKIWSSACSTGEEPYTMVMILARFIPVDEIKVIATDIDAAAIAKAKEAIYSKKSIENLPMDFLNKYFTFTGENFELSERIKKCVHFKQLDLLRDSYPDNCDIIVCRNVLIYFTEEAKNKIYIRFNKAFKNGGILYVGNTEQILYPSRFKLKPIRTFYYMKEESL